MATLDKQALVDAIRKAIEESGNNWISLRQFLSHSGLKNSDIFRYFSTWSEAVEASGIELKPDNQKIAIEDLLVDWAEVVRRLRQIPARRNYRFVGRYSYGAFRRRFGSWSDIPLKFREYAQQNAEWADEWADVLTLISVEVPETPNLNTSDVPISSEVVAGSRETWHSKIGNRLVYGDPINFRGLQHEPVNEQGVVFLFGMVAKELGYLVEVVRSEFPDCEAKHKIGPSKWERVKIEFEFESRNFREHNHSASECDVIVCWRHNWKDIPPHIEIVELQTEIKKLAKSDE
jgi:hypothetical protein